MMPGGVVILTRRACCAHMRREPIFTLSVGGLTLPGFPVTLEHLSSYVKDLLKNPKFKILGQKPGPKSVLMDIYKPEDVDMILSAGGEINICENYQPLVS